MAPSLAQVHEEGHKSDEALTSVSKIAAKSSKNQLTNLFMVEVAFFTGSLQGLRSLKFNFLSAETKHQLQLRSFYGSKNDGDDARRSTLRSRLLAKRTTRHENSSATEEAPHSSVEMIKQRVRNPNWIRYALLTDSTFLRHLLRKTKKTIFLPFHFNLRL